MANRRPHRTTPKRPLTAGKRSHAADAAGISNRPPQEEEAQQQQLPPRGQAQKNMPGEKG